MNGSVNNQNNNQNQNYGTNPYQNNQPMNNTPYYGNNQSLNNVPTYSNTVQSTTPVNNVPTYGSTVQSTTPVNNVPTYGSTVQSTTPVNSVPTYGNTVQSTTPVNNVPTYGSTVQSTTPVNNVPTYGNTVQGTTPVNNVPTYGNTVQGTTPVNNVPTYGNTVQGTQPVNSVPTYGSYMPNNQPMNNTPYYGYNQYNMNNKKSGGNKALPIILVILLVAIVGGVLILFGGNKKSKPSITPDKNAEYERTIMIYMVGSNLESEGGYGTADLDSLDYNALKNQNTKVILIAGGSKTWYNTYIDVKSTSIYELTEDGFKVVKNQSKKNMGEASVLTEFLNFGYDNYKSKKYDLLFWNHGLGVLGSESDELNGHDYLTPAEMTVAFKNSRFNEKNKLEAVLFRTCLNGTIEIADTLKNYSNYMVASEEVTNAYQNSAFLKYLNTVDKNDDGKALGKKYTDGYKEYIETFNSMHPLDKLIYTYSVIDLSKIDQLEKSVNDFFSDIDVEKNYNTISRVRANLRQYGSEEPGYDSVDLYTLVNNLKSLSPTKGQKVLSDISACVVYSKTNEVNSKGLSIYFPYNGPLNFRKETLSKNYEFAGLSKYKTFVTTLTNIQSSNSKGASFLENSANIVNTSETDADFSIELTDEQKETYSNASYIVFRDNKDGTYLPVYRSNNVKLDGNKLSVNIRGRQLKVIDKSTNEDNIMNLIEVEETNDYIKYETYGVLEYLSDTDINKWKMHSAHIYLILDKKTNKVSIGNILIKPESKEKNIDSTVSEPYTVAADLKDYTHVAIGSSSYKILDDNGNFTEDWTSNGVYKGLEVKPENIDFGLEDYTSDYTYYAVFKIVDINKNISYSKLVKMK